MDGLVLAQTYTDLAQELYTYLYIQSFQVWRKSIQDIQDIVKV